MQNIEIDRLIPNPLNPRKNLGDLSELTASIKSNGILQNLSVVKIGEHVLNITTGATDGFDYMVVIGHRRLAAAKEAGLKAVPCEVLELSEAEQVAMMLAENMQRNSLTKFEETAGIQQALDLGLSESEVAEKTGFTKQTITKHKKVMKLGADKVEQFYAKGASIDEMLKLNEIKDSNERKELEQSLGEDNFNYVYEAMILRQKKKPILEKIAKSVEEKFKAKNLDHRIWGEETERIYDFDEDKINALKKKSGKYSYYVDYENLYVELYREAPESETENPVQRKKTPAQIEKEKQEERRNVAFATAKQCRIAFIRSLLKTKFEMPKNIRHEILADMVIGNLGYMDDDIFAQIIDSSQEEYAANEKNDDKLLLVYMYCSLTNRNGNFCICWDNTFDDEDDEDMVLLYKYLVKLGYAESDTEKSILDGSWELFEK